MDKRPHTPHREKVVRLLGVAESVFIVLAAYVRRQPMAQRNHLADRQNLDKQFARLAGDKRPFFVCGRSTFGSFCLLLWKGRAFALLAKNRRIL